MIKLRKIDICDDYNYDNCCNKAVAMSSQKKMPGINILKIVWILVNMLYYKTRDIL